MPLPSDFSATFELSTLKGRTATDIAASTVGCCRARHAAPGGDPGDRRQYQNHRHADCETPCRVEPVRLTLRDRLCRAVGQNVNVSAFGRRRHRWNRHRRNESIPTPGHSLDKARVVGCVAERLTQLPHGGVQPVVEINESARRPEALAHDFPRNDFARVVEQQGQQLKWLFLKPQLDSRLRSSPESKSTSNVPNVLRFTVRCNR